MVVVCCKEKQSPADTTCQLGQKRGGGNMERLQFFSSVVFHLVGLSKHGWLGSTTRVSALVGLGWGLRMCISSSAHLGGRNPSLLEVY